MSSTDLGNSGASSSHSIYSSESSQLPEQEPRLGWVEESKRLDTKVLERRRFCITIESVYYYVDSGRISCAILLKTSFLLRAREKLAFANVPLIAKPSADIEKGSLERIDISAHFPTDEEYVKVGQLSGSKDIHATPVLSASVGGIGAGFEGLGVDQHVLLDKPHMISLNPVRAVLADCPTSLRWTFEDSNDIFYPRNTRLLVIVSKTTDKNELWFPFELRLEWTLKVDIHGFLPRVTRLVARSDKHEGWCFKITGQYQPNNAKDALEDAKLAKKTNKIPSFVGLRAAAKPWMTAQNTAVFTSPVPPPAPENSTPMLT